MGMNWVQESIHHGNNSLQDARTMSPNPLQVDVSLYDSSVGSGKKGMNPCSGVFLQSAYRTATNHVDKDPRTITRLQEFKTPSVNTFSQGHNAIQQGFHEKKPFMSSSVLGPNADAPSARDRENLLGMQQRHILSSQGSVALDPLEEKILYHMDDNVQDSSFGRNKDEIVSSGFSLSGLMQCALAEEADPLDGNGSDQVPNVHSLTTSLENACTNSSWMKRSCLASSSSSVHPISNLHDIPQYAHWAKSSFDIYQDSVMAGQTQHTEFSMRYLKTGDGSDCRAGKQLQEENLRPKNSESGIKPSSNAWHPDNGLNNSAMQCLDVVNQNAVALRPKKRKSTTFSQSPWHTVVLQGSDMSKSIGFFSKNLAFATNGMLEKAPTSQVEDKVSASEPITPLKRRLMLSTQLMQQLLPPVSSLTLSENADVCYESVLYFASRIALGEACSLTSGKICEEIVTTKTASDKDHQYAHVCKIFTEKIQKLDSDFQRSDKTTSIVDIIVEIQDMERFSVINRFAKFHTRAQANTSRCPSSPAMSRSVPQRYVTGLVMPKTLPEGVHCLPL